MAQRWKIDTTVQVNVDMDHELSDQDGEVIDTGTEWETYYHDEPLGPQDWSTLGEFVDGDRDDGEGSVLMIFERFDTVYDRSAEEHIPVLVITTVQLWETGEQLSPM